MARSGHMLNHFLIGSVLLGVLLLLLDAWAKSQVSEDLAVRVGQFKLPTWHECAVSETRETDAERSVVDVRFSQGAEFVLRAQFQALF